MMVLGTTIAITVRQNAEASTSEGTSTTSSVQENGVYALVMSSNEIDTSDSSEIMEIERTILSGKPVVIEGVGDTLPFTTLPTADLNSDANAYYHNDQYNATCYYSFNGPEADRMAQEWSKNIEQRVLNAGENGESDYMRYETGQTWDDEKFSAETASTFYKLGSVDGRTYYVVYNYFKAFVDKPGSERAVADMSIYSDIKAENVFQELGDTYPDSWTAPEAGGSHEFSIGLSFKGLKLSLEDESEWHFEVSNANVDNSSSTSKDIYSIIFDFNEQHFEFNNAVMRTGAIISVDNGSTFETTFDYHVQFREDYNNFWPWDPGYSWYNHTISVPVNINPMA